MATRKFRVTRFIEEAIEVELPESDFDKSQSASDMDEIVREEADSFDAGAWDVQCTDISVEAIDACRECGVSTEHDNDTYDSLCGNCADRAYADGSK